MLFFVSSFQKGQTLIEVLAAFGIAVSLVSAITITVIFALSSAQFSKNTNLATQDAQQGIEILRRMPKLQDVNGKDLNSAPYCLSASGALTAKDAPDCPPDANTFVRQVIVVSDPSLCGSAKAKRVIIDVSWSDSKCTDTNNLYCHKTEITSCLSTPQ